MSQSLWEPEAAEEAQPEEQPQPEQQMEARPEEEHSAGPGTLSLSMDDFTALEERILRAVNLVKRERQTRMDAEARAVQAEARLVEQEPVMEQMQKDLDALRAERDHVRQRVERLLAQLDALEL